MAVRKDISFVDLEGRERTETYYFHLGKTDWFELDVAHRENPSAYLMSLMQEGNSRELWKLWKQMLFAAVARRDGDILVKNARIQEEFAGSGAFEALFEELINSEDAGGNFFLSMMPEDVRKQAEAQKNRQYTDQELLEMSDDEFYLAAGTRDPKEMDKHFLVIAMKRAERKKSPAA